MAFPSFSIMTPSGERAHSEPDPMDEPEPDGEKFIIDSTQLYDMVFVDAYDGEAMGAHSPFLKSLSSRLHPEHGTVVVNLHADTDLLNDDGSVPQEMLLPMGKVCQKGLQSVQGCDTRKWKPGFWRSMFWCLGCSSSLVVSRGFRKSIGFMDTGIWFLTLVSNSLEVGSILNLPFSCLEYIKRGLNLVI